MTFRLFGTFWTRLATSTRIFFSVLRDRAIPTSALYLEMVKIGPTEIPVFRMGVHYMPVSTEQLQEILKGCSVALAIKRIQEMPPGAAQGDV